jgi:hypothetical protein
MFAQLVKSFRNCLTYFSLPATNSTDREFDDRIPSSAEYPPSDMVMNDCGPIVDINPIRTEETVSDINQNRTEETVSDINQDRTEETVSDINVIRTEETMLDNSDDETVSSVTPATPLIIDDTKTINVFIVKDRLSFCQPNRSVYNSAFRRGLKKEFHARWNKTEGVWHSINQEKLDDLLYFLQFHYPSFRFFPVDLSYLNVNPVPIPEI